MKTRTGFVSNSSTSSFLIYGVCFSRDQLRQKFPGLESNKEEENVGLGWALDNAVEKYKQLETHYQDGVYSYSFYVGSDPRTACGEETIRQFKDRTEKLIREACGDDIPKLGWLDAAWCDH
jgi:hypothetical protein